VGTLSSEESVQQAHEADRATEDFREDIFDFEAYCVQFGRTAQVARQLMREPLVEDEMK